MHRAVAFITNYVQRHRKHGDSMQQQSDESLEATPCGWSGTIQEFLSVNKHPWLAQLSGHHERHSHEVPSTAQRLAWDHCFDILRDELAQLMLVRPTAASWANVFEYELPRERGRRPDVVLLTGATIVVLEFKDYSTALPAHLDQVSAYARDLHHYHAASHGCDVISVLIPTRFTGQVEECETVWVTPPHALAALLDQLVPVSQGQPDVDLHSWLAA